MIFQHQGNKYIVPIDRPPINLYEAAEHSLKHILSDDRFILLSIKNNELQILPRYSQPSSQIKSPVFLFTASQFEAAAANQHPASQQSSVWQSVRLHSSDNRLQEDSSIIQLHEKDLGLQLPEIKLNSGADRPEGVASISRDNQIQQFQNPEGVAGQLEMPEVKGRNEEDVSARLVEASVMLQSEIQQKEVIRQSVNSKYEIAISKGLNIDIKCRPSEEKEWVVGFTNVGFRDWPHNKVGIYNIQTGKRLKSVPLLGSQCSHEVVVDCQARQGIKIAQLQFGYESTKGYRLYFGPILRGIIDASDVKPAL